MRGVVTTAGWVAARGLPLSVAYLTGYALGAVLTHLNNRRTTT